jgi:hypothetical protein
MVIGIGTSLRDPLAEDREGVVAPPLAVKDVG